MSKEEEINKEQKEKDNKDFTVTSWDAPGSAD